MRRITIALVAIGGATLPLMALRSLNAAEAMHIVGFSADVRTPPVGWAPQDPADSAWRAARSAFNANEWQRAAESFRRIRTDYKTSAYRGQSFYYEAYARAQIGGSSQLRQARALLETLAEDWPDEAKKIRDVPALMASIDGRLSKDYGDEPSAAKLRANASSSTTDCPEDDDDSPRVAALNALLQMDAEAAMPLLEKIMARRDKCSEGLRQKAVWLIAQKRTTRSADILLEAAKNDPDKEVREQAVFWLSQVDSQKAIVALEEILRTSKEESLQENALFALSQNKSPRAAQLLRDYAGRNDISSDLRGTAIHWLGQTGDESNFAFLRDLFAKVSDNDVKEQIMFAISQRRSTESATWLMNIVMDEKSDMDMRKQALFWASQAAGSGNKTDSDAVGLSSSKLVALYDRMSDQEMKEQLIFVYAQRKDSAFVDKLIDIARNEKNPELRKGAIFWLGQSFGKDPRVIKLLSDLING